MKTPVILVCVLGCFLALGCRTNPKITMLEQECRMHEDRIYALQDELQMSQSSLQNAQQKNAAFRQQGADGPKLAPSSRSSSSKSIDPHADAPVDVNVQLPGTDTGLNEVSPDALENMGGASSGPSKNGGSGDRDKPSVRDPDALPSLETPAMPLLKWDKTSPLGESIPSGKPIETQTRIEQGKVLYQSEGPRLRGDSREVKEITISKLMTGGVNADGQDGDEGIFVVVEPRDAQGRLVPAVGPISIVAFDPALPEEKARLAQWSFSEKEVANQFRRSGSAEGFHLEVRWPEVLPRHENLRLFVRYTTADSRKLYAEAPIQIALAPKASTLVARPAPRLLSEHRFEEKPKGWASKPKSTLTSASPPTTSPRVASAPSRPIRQAIPPVSNAASKKPVYIKRPTARPRPVWSPQR